MNTVYEIRWENKATRRWLQDNLHYEAYQETHKILFHLWRWVIRKARGVVVEHRYIDDIVEGLNEDGFQSGTDFKVYG